MNIQITVIGRTPLLMHNPRMVDPNFEISREIKKLTSKRKKTDDDLNNIERLEWFGGIYEENGIVVQPTSKLRKCLINTAKRISISKISRLGKAVERSLSFFDLNVPLVYDGPRDIKDIFKNKKFHSRLSVGVNNKRVMRVRPQFMPWSFTVRGIFVEDTGLQYEELEGVVKLAGTIEGIGDNRVNGYGRFAGEILNDD